MNKTTLGIAFITWRIFPDNHSFAVVIMFIVYSNYFWCLLEVADKYYYCTTKKMFHLIRITMF